MDKDVIHLDLIKIKLKDLVSKEIYNLLAEKKLPYKKIQEMAVDLLETLDNVKTTEQLFLLIEKLPEIYPYLKSVSELMSAELKEIKEKVVINKLEGYLKNKPI